MNVSPLQGICPAVAAAAAAAAAASSLRLDAFGTQRIRAISDVLEARLQRLNTAWKLKSTSWYVLEALKCVPKSQDAS